MNRRTYALATVTLLCVLGAALIMLLRNRPVPPPPLTFAWTLVDHAGNEADATTYGAVPYPFFISKHEVTNDQYAQFLNAVAVRDPYALYNVHMHLSLRGGITRSGEVGNYTYAVKKHMGNKPVNFVSFFDAMRFVNWLENGQGKGTTETGVYTIGSGVDETRAQEARFFLPSENEWYKAAYHDPARTTPGKYWLYPTRSDAPPVPATADPEGNITSREEPTANYMSSADWNGPDGNVTTVGSGGMGNASFYGAADMAGNLWEWNEAVVAGSARGFRGGSWKSPEFELRATGRKGSDPSLEFIDFGFRVACSTNAISQHRPPAAGTH